MNTFTLEKQEELEKFSKWFYRKRSKDLSKKKLHALLNLLSIDFNDYMEGMK